ncbi:MAG: carboxypeptidase-like regulatory domain-containing protein, partial [Candidatus Symbiothrix sp.]|nr:carboxypeptidase-like regulatory domain-containing protein [Candidatus Symbiothrix sp.]
MFVNKIIIFLTSLFCSQIAFSQNSIREVEIKGVITDHQTGDRLPGAYLFIKGTSTGTTSDNKGQYVLHLNKGTYIICGSFMGYQTKEIPLNADVSQTINIQLESGTHQLDEVIISSRAKNDNITSVTMGIERMSIKEIQRLPALMGEVDILKVIQLLPGVQATTEGGSG